MCCCCRCGQYRGGGVPLAAVLVGVVALAAPVAALLVQVFAVLAVVLQVAAVTAGAVAVGGAGYRAVQWRRGVLIHRAVSASVRPALPAASGRFGPVRAEAQRLDRIGVER